jgi:adenylate kinase
LVEARVAEPDARGGIILDGYPRTVNQAAVLLQLTERLHLRPFVVHLVVDYETIVARLSGRRQCPVCGTLYNLVTHPPRVPGTCDLEGATLVTREDDRESVIRERLNQYDMQTRPLIRYFREAGVSIFEIDGGAGAPDQVSRQICDSFVSAGLIDRSKNGSRQTHVGSGVSSTL